MGDAQHNLKHVHLSIVHRRKVDPSRDAFSVSCVFCLILERAGRRVERVGKRGGTGLVTMGMHSRGRFTLESGLKSYLGRKQWATRSAGLIHMRVIQREQIARGLVRWRKTHFSQLG